MAVETIVIKITQDSKELDKTIDKLVEMGVVDKKNAQQFKKTDDSFQKGQKGNKEATEKTTTSVESQGKGLLNLDKQIKKLAVTIGGFFALSKIKQGIDASVQSFEEFEKTSANVLTLLSEAERLKFGDVLKEGSRELMTEFGLSIEDTNKALFDAISAGVPAANAINFLRENAKLAIGGVTSLGTAVDGTTTIMNAFGLEQEQLTDVTAAFFSSQKAGKTTVEELAQSIGTVAPIAALAGVSFQELLAAQATLTKGGISTTESATAIKGALTALINPSKEAADILTKLGVPVGATEVKAVGFTEAMNRLNKAAAENPDIIAQAIPNIRGLTAVTALSGENFEVYSEILNQVNTDVGENSSLQEAFAIQMETSAQRSARLNAEAEELAITFGAKLAPIVNDVKEFFISLGKFVLENADAFKFIGKQILIAATTFVVYRTVLFTIDKVQKIVTTGTIVLGIAKKVLSGNVKGAALAFKGLSKAMKAVPLIALIAGIIEAAIAFRDWITATEDAEVAQARLTKRLDDQRAAFELLEIARQDEIASIRQLIKEQQAAGEDTAELEQDLFKTTQEGVVDRINLRSEEIQQSNQLQEQLTEETLALIEERNAANLILLEAGAAAGLERDAIFKVRELGLLISANENLLNEEKQLNINRLAERDAFEVELLESQNAQSVFQIEQTTETNDELAAINEQATKDAVKAREKRNKEIADSAKKLADLLIEVERATRDGEIIATQEGLDQQLSLLDSQAIAERDKIELDTQRKLDAIVGNSEEETALREALVLSQAQQLQAVDDKIFDEQQKTAEEHNKELFEIEQAALELQNKERTKQLLESGLSQDEIDAQRLVNQQAFLQEQIDLAKEFGFATIDLELELAELTEAQRQQILAESLTFQEALLAAEQQLQDARIQAAQAFVGALRDLSGEQKELALGLFLLQKALAIGQIIIETQREIAAIAAANAPLGAIGIPLTAAQIIAAKIRAATGIATIVATTIGEVAAFNEGIDYVPLGKNKPGKDTVDAKLTVGEAVIKEQMNKKYKGLSAAFNDDKIEDWFHNRYAPPVYHNTNVADKRNKELGDRVADTMESEGFYDDNIVRGIGKASDRDRENAKYIVKHITKAINRRHNPRNG